MVNGKEILNLISEYMSLKPESREEVKEMMREHEHSEELAPLLALMEGYEEYAEKH